MNKLFDDGIKNGADFSDDGLYRFTLLRQWNPELPSIAFLCLNPSTATAEIPDPTVTRCVQFSKDWCFGRFWMLNLFAWRSTDPKGLLTTDDPIGSRNDQAIAETIAAVDVVCCAWGTHSGKVRPLIAARVPQVLAMIPEAKRFCLKLNGDGQPGHPLFLKGDLTLQRFTPVSPVQKKRKST